MQHSRDGGVAYVNKIVTLGASVFVVITIIATVLAPFLVFVYSQQAADDGKGFTPAHAGADRPRGGLRVLVPAADPLLRAVLPARRGLNAKQYFGPFTWAPLINNVIAIAGLVVFIALFGGQDVNSSVDAWTLPKIAVLAGSASLGVFAQAASCRSSGSVRA